MWACISFKALSHFSMFQLKMENGISKGLLSGSKVDLKGDPNIKFSVMKHWILCFKKKKKSAHILKQQATNA